MPTPERWRHPGVALLLPAALIGLGAWQLTRIAGAAEGFAQRAGRVQASIERLQPLAARDPGAVVRFNDNPQSYTATEALQLMQETETDLHRDAVIDQARQGAAWATLGGGGVALLAVLGCLAAATFGAWRGRRSRSALVGSFRAVVRVPPPLLGGVAVGTAVAVLGAVLFEAGGIWFLDSIDTGEIKLLLLGLAMGVGAVIFAISSVRKLRQALHGFTPEPMQVLGRAAGPEAAPGLWSFVRGIAAGQGAAAPDNVVLGMTQGFFATSSPILLLPEQRVLAGRSLYLPAPMLPLLSRGEIAAIVAHELAHFTGEDTQYSQHFLPLYAGMERSMDAVAAKARSTSPGFDAVFQPAAVLAGHVMDTFSRTVAHWSRLRELEADRASLTAGDGHAAATALVRTGIGAGLIGGAIGEMYDRPAIASPDLVETVLARAGMVGFLDPARHLEDRQPHPTDTHPPTRQRIEALGIPADEALLAAASRPVQAEDAAFTAGLFRDWSGLRGALGTDLLAVATARDRRLQANLEAAAGALAADIPLHEHTQPAAAVVVAVLGGLFVLAALFATWVGLFSGWVGHSDDTLLVLSGAAGLAAMGGLVLAATWFRHRRSKAGPFLVLGAEGFRCIGVAGLVPWSAVDRVHLAVGNNWVTTFHLNDSQPLPEQTGYRWTVKLNRRKRLLRLEGYVAHGMKPQAYLDLLNRGLRGHRAAVLLRERALHEAARERA